AAKEVMNIYTWTLGATHTPAGFLAVAGQALSYDITDTVASFLFGLAFAPELARVLARMRARMDVTWVPGPPAEIVEAGARGRGAGSAERAPRRAHGARRPASRSIEPARSGRPRAHDSRAAWLWRLTSLTARRGGWGPRQKAARLPQRRWIVRPSQQPHGLR